MSRLLQICNSYEVFLTAYAHVLDIWFTARISYNYGKEEVREKTIWWYQEHKAVMLKKALQVLDTSRELWLLYLHEKNDLTALKKDIDTTVKEHKLCSVPFALVYTNI